MTTIYGYATPMQLNSRSLAAMRVQLDDLARQLASGKKSDSFSGLGLDRGLVVETRTRLSRITAFETAIDTVDVRATIMTTTLERIRMLGVETRGETRFPDEFLLVADGQTAAQRASAIRFDEAVNLLNERVGERYLFSGRAADTRATAEVTDIMNGTGARAGLKQVMAERLLADQGTDGRGRLDAPTSAASVVTLAEDGAHPFGFKLASVTTSFGATVTPDAGPPPSIDIDLGATLPPAGSMVRVTLTLPDGTTKDIELQASTQNPPMPGRFHIGADTTEAAANLASALDAEIQRVARVDLAAASAMQASEDFFAIDADNPPQRVAGPPFESATALVDGSEADTVLWYTGDAATDDPRQTAIARVDEDITVAYGVRANEDGIRQVVQQLGVLAAMSFDESDADARDRYFALLGRIGNVLDGADGVSHLEAIETDLSGANLTAATAGERLTDKKPMLTGILADIENASPEEVGSMLLALNTRLQATLQTTAMLSRFSLLNFI
jgi:hypothetical protein